MTTAVVSPTTLLRDPDNIRAALAAGADTVTKIVRLITGGRHGSTYNAVVVDTAVAAGIELPAAVHAHGQPLPTRGRVHVPPAPVPLRPAPVAPPVGERFEVPEADGTPIPERGRLADHTNVRAAVAGAVSIGEILHRLGYANRDCSRTTVQLRNVCAYLNLPLPVNESVAAPSSQIDELTVDELEVAARQPTPYRALDYIGMARNADTARRLVARVDAENIGHNW